MQLSHRHTYAGIYLCLCTEIIYCEEKAGCGILLELAAPICCVGGRRDLLAPRAAEGDMAGEWHWVPGALLGCCGMPPPPLPSKGLLCKKPSALRGDSPGRYGAARSSLQRRTLPGEGSGGQEGVLTIPVEYPCTSRFTQQELCFAPLQWFPAAGSLPGLFYCFGLHFSRQQAGWVSVSLFNEEPHHRAASQKLDRF